MAEFGIPIAVASSDFHAVVDEDGFIACGDCVESCQFGALFIPEYACMADYTRCVGCGLCVVACPTSSMQLERRPEDDASPLPADIKEWMAQRAQERNISILEIL